MSTITRFRGDTSADQFTITRDSLPVNIAGFTFLLTVNREENPVDITNQLFSLAGTITDPAAGQVEFAPDATQADQTPGAYYYDVQMTDTSGAKQTVQKGRYRFKQDITK